MVLSAVAVAGTAAAVAGGVALSDPGHAGVLSAETSVAPPSLDASASATTAQALRDRAQTLSRSASRVATREAKKARTAHAHGAHGAAVRGVRSTHRVARVDRSGAQRHTAAARTAVSNEDPKQIASGMLPSYGWDSGQFGCLVDLWNRESGWRVDADNPSSGAYGIPQSLPGSKMASAGADWRTDAATQIRWGLGYIRDSYGSPCGAWDHSQATGWY